MKSKELKLPAELAESKKINSDQKLILSVLSEEPQMYAGNIARRIGSRTQQVKEQLNDLINQNYVTSDNNQDRPSYARVKGLGFVGSKVESKKEFVNNFSKKSYNINNNNINNYNLAKAKLLTNSVLDETLLSSEDKANLCFDYWISKGMRKHRPDSQMYADSIDSLVMLFNGTMFKNVPDRLIHDPIKAKTFKFQVEDFKTALDNLITASQDYAFHPPNKKKAKAFVKNLNLKDFIYHINIKNPDQKRSPFMQYLRPLELVSTVDNKYERLSEVLIMIIKREVVFSFDDDMVIQASNMYGDLMSKHNEESIYSMWKDSDAQVCELFTDFINTHDQTRLQQHWIIKPWFFDKFENWLKNTGLITE